MGGNLFQLGRLPRRPYLQLENRLRPVLTERFGDQWRIPLVHTDKADFGDLDILISQNVLTPEALHKFALQTGVLQVRRTGQVISHELPLRDAERHGTQSSFQVDFFRTPADELQVRHDFMSWGDLGNILGRMVRKWNLKWGEDGLVYVHRRENDDHYKAELSISTEIGDVLSLLELDAAVHQRGFLDEREMFEWVMDSPHFSPRSYQQQKGKFKNRTEKRRGMERFATLVLSRFDVDVQERSPRHDRQEVQRLFPDVPLMAWLEEEDRQAERDLIRKAKFSGTRVMSLHPELRGPSLGIFIQQLRASAIEGQPFDDWVLDQEQNVIDGYILAFRIL